MSPYDWTCECGRHHNRKLFCSAHACNQRSPYANAKPPDSQSAQDTKEEPEQEYPIGGWSEMKYACKAARCYCEKLANPCGVAQGPILQGAAHVYVICNKALEAAERAEKNLLKYITEDAE